MNYYKKENIGNSTSNGSGESDSQHTGESCSCSKHAQSYSGGVVRHEVGHSSDIGSHHAGVEEISARQEEGIRLEDTCEEICQMSKVYKTSSAILNAHSLHESKQKLV